jgi:hypothetical protein
MLGWREWVALPDWGVAHLKAKIDTGARTSSLHAFGLEWFDRGGNPWVRFEIHPLQRSVASSIVAEAPVIATRDVKSSSGDTEHRPVVHTTLVIAGRAVIAEVTLTRRDEMGFRMLVGREALRNRFVVDPGVSYLGGRPDKSIRRRNRLTDDEARAEPPGPTARKRTPVRKAPGKKAPGKQAATPTPNTPGRGAS